MLKRLAGYDAMLLPTTPTVPPRLDACGDDAEYGRLNLLALRNPTVINMIDGCAVSLPVHERGGPPVGLMLAACHGQDARLLQMAGAVERLLQRDRLSSAGI